jgi:hypothetical protein
MRGAEIVTVSGEEVPLLSMPRLAVVRGRLTGLWAEADVNFSWTISPAKLDREQAMAIIIADEDVKWLLPKRDCIGDARRLGDLDGAAVRRVPYVVRHCRPGT